MCLSGQILIWVNVTHHLINLYMNKYLSSPTNIIVSSPPKLWGGNLLGGRYYDVVNCVFTIHMGGEVCMGGEPIFMLGGGGARGNLKKNAKEISHIEIFRS